VLPLRPQDMAQHRYSLPLVVAKGLPVGGDEQQGRDYRAPTAATSLHLVLQPFVHVGRVRHPEGDGIGEMSVAYKDGDLPAVGQMHPVGACLYLQVAAHLLVGEDGEANALRCHDLQRLVVHRHLRQPHPLRLVAEAVRETGDTPTNLADFVTAAGQRQDGVVDRLGQPVADGVDFPIPSLGGDDALVGSVGVPV